MFTELDKHVHILLFDKLESFFSNHGFVYLKDKFQFRKNTLEGYQNIVYTSLENKKELLFELFLGSRNSVIEHLAQQVLSTPADYVDDSNTLIISMGQLSNIKYLQFVITNEIDLQDVIEELESYFLDFGFGFLNNINTLVDIEYILNKEPYKNCVFVKNHLNRAVKGLIAAKILNKSNYSKLYEIYLNNLTGLPNTAEDIEVFKKLNNFLLYQSVN